MNKIFALMLLCATVFFVLCSNDDDLTLVESVSLLAATITVITEDSNKTATCVVTVAGKYVGYFAIGRDAMFTE